MLLTGQLHSTIWQGNYIFYDGCDNLRLEVIAKIAPGCVESVNALLLNIPEPIRILSPLVTFNNKCPVALENPIIFTKFVVVPSVIWIYPD